jgi:hypothetical protein
MILTNKGEIEVTKSNSDALKIVHSDKSRLVKFLTPANGSVVDLDAELHFGFQVWFCGDKVWYLFNDPYRPETPTPPQDYVCQPAIQIADYATNELLQPTWSP